MRSVVHGALLLVVLGSFAEVQAQGGDRPAAAPVALVAQEPPVAELSDLRAHPLRWRGRTARVVVQLGPERTSWEPGLTRFDQRRFRAWAAWSDDARLWHADQHADPLPGLYVRRDADAARTLAAAGAYTRLELDLVLRAVSGGEAWIEVTAARRLPRAVGEGTLIHAGRARAFLAEGQPAAAAAELERALAAPLPDRHRAALEEERAVALARARREAERAR